MEWEITRRAGADNDDICVVSAVSPEAGEAVVSELIVPVPAVPEVARRGSITELV